ncbi:MAG: endolytic transglycosylase MltG [Oscillospiraceae bacterium]|nr:endolytic transglycosylase MltG [Oscillospiraceae bacterium]
MDDRNQNPGQPQQPGQPRRPMYDPGEVFPPGARQPFQLDLSFDTMEYAADTGSLWESDAPKSKGEIYFANPPKPAQPTPAPRPPKKKKQRSGALVALAMALSLSFTFLFSWIGITMLRDVFAIGKVSKEVSVRLPPDLSTREVIGLLSKNRLIQQRALCALYSDFTFWIKTRNVENPKLPEYLGGEYVVNTNMGLEELLNSFKPQPKSNETATLFFPEGYTVRQVVDKIGKFRVTRVDVLQSSLLSTNFEFPFLQNIDTNGRYYRYEGYLFPDTYEFYVNENANSVLNRFFQNFSGKWTEEYATRAKELNMSVDDVITLASIIQAEAANAEQMKDVSGVLHNRLNNSDAYPMLECDATRDYVTNNILPRMDLVSARYYYEIYNTYQCTGLPVGPICNPGIDAIEAALKPAKHSYFFFLHDKNGKIYLSKTKPEHDQKSIDLAKEGLAQ